MRSEWDKCNDRDFEGAVLEVLLEAIGTLMSFAKAGTCDFAAFRLESIAKLRWNFLILCNKLFCN